MKIIKLDPYKNLSDEELVDEIFNNIGKLRTFQEVLKDEEMKENKDYMILFMSINDLFKEGKRRKLKLDNRNLTKRILKC